MLLFVYGTLRRGQPAQGLLRGARYVGAARTAPRFELVDFGEYPALVRGGATSVSGEIYEVDAGALEKLDLYEDCPRHFMREVVELGGEHAARGPCEAYVMPAASASSLPRIASGDWTTRPR
jgi:gamma-glutamylcyclotransferase (GGCT)/AIG2-like uncharacterized protein YtfP